MGEVKTKRLKSIAKIYLVVLLFFIYVYSYPTYASVVLNEVAIQPNQVVELYNTASTSADISSWYIDDAGGTTYFTIPNQTVLAPQSCFLFISDFNFNKSSSDTVRLFDNTAPPTTSSAKLVDQYCYIKAPDSNYSFSKKMDGGTEWQTATSTLGYFNGTLLSCIPSPTPTAVPIDSPTPLPTTTPSPTNQPTDTPTPTPIVDYQNILLSEIYPYPPPNEHEWIELYNGNDKRVNLDRWYIDDGENTGGTPKSFSLTLSPYSYGIVELTSSLFNNNGDSVRLLDSNKNEKDSMEYGKIGEGKSIGRLSFIEDSFCEQEQSKNALNYSCLSEPTKPTPLQPSSSIKNGAILLRSITLMPKKTTQNQLPNQIGSINTLDDLPSQPKGEVLGEQTNRPRNTSPIPYLSFISSSYSLLTIVSVFIKMRNAS